MIRVQGISKKIKDNLVLDNLDFEVKDAEIVGLVGPNGAGKTTLLNIIAGIWPPDNGTVEIDGVCLCAGRENIKKDIGYVPDVPFFYPKLTGREFLSFVGTLYALAPGTLTKKMAETEKALELSSWMDELMEGYPRGIKQKMTLAAMLLHTPKIILLDEPLTNLDPKSSKLVKELLQKLSKSGASILLSTHILEIAERLCRRIVVIDKGRKIAEGSVEQLREFAKKPGSGLEDIFLQLTGGTHYSELLRYIS